jgi:hypothetical protein
MAARSRGGNAHRRLRLAIHIAGDSSVTGYRSTVPDPVLNQAGFWPLDAPNSQEVVGAIPRCERTVRNPDPRRWPCLSQSSGRPSDGLERDLRTPLMLTASGERAKVQNEILDAKHDAMGSGIRATCAPGERPPAPAGPLPEGAEAINLSHPRACETTIIPRAPLRLVDSADRCGWNGWRTGPEADCTGVGTRRISS